MRERLAAAEKKNFDLTDQLSKLKEENSALKVYWKMHVGSNPRLFGVLLNCLPLPCLYIAL